MEPLQLKQEEIHFKEESEEKDIPGPSGVDCSKKNEPHVVDSKTGINMEIDKDTQQDENDFKINDKLSNCSSASEESEDESIEEEVTEESDVEDKFEKIRVKCYSSFSVKEDPVENIKFMFKTDMLEFERQNFHRQIFEGIINESGQLNSHDLQKQYLNHLHDATNIEIFTCSLCNYQTMNKNNLNCHLIVVHNGKMENDIFRCTVCNYEANYRSSITKHMEKHKKAKKSVKKKNKRERFPCTQCSYTGRSEEKLRKHMTSHKDRSYCDLCSYQSNKKEELQTHKDTHKDGKKFLCYMCPFTITNKATLGRHLLNIHKIANEASKRSKICEICSFSCSNNNQLQIHYLTHKTVKDLKEDEIFKCPEPGCNHQTKLKSHLRVHMKIHKPPEFICEVCGFATRRKENYNDHLVTHKRLDEIEWLRCAICPYQARNKKLLNVHMRKGDHSGKKLLHVRNRDRLREAEEKGEDINVLIKKYRIKKINGVEIPRERIRRPRDPNRKRVRKPRKKGKPESSASVVDEALINFHFGELAEAIIVKNEAES